MFWWKIGELTGNATMIGWSRVAEKWTAEHQWNYTNDNGGDMTCLNGGALPDTGSPDLYDWVQGSALYSFSTIGSPQHLYSTTTSSSTVLFFVLSVNRIGDLPGSRPAGVDCRDCRRIDCLWKKLV